MLYFASGTPRDPPVLLQSCSGTCFPLQEHTFGKRTSPSQIYSLPDMYFLLHPNKIFNNFAANTSPPSGVGFCLCHKLTTFSWHMFVANLPSGSAHGERFAKQFHSCLDIRHQLLPERCPFAACRFFDFDVCLLGQVCPLLTPGSRALTSRLLA